MHGNYFEWHRTATNRYFLRQKLAAYVPAYSINATSLTWQTDPGREFPEHAQGQGPPRAARNYGAEHRCIPPRHYAWRSDVETAPRLAGNEFSDRDRFRSRTDFRNKATTDQHSPSLANLARPTRDKEWSSPPGILPDQAPNRLGTRFAWRPGESRWAGGPFRPAYHPSKGGMLYPAFPSSANWGCRLMTASL
jgi:hypothetical protein